MQILLTKLKTFSSVAITVWCFLFLMFLSSLLCCVFCRVRHISTIRQFSALSSYCRKFVVVVTGTHVL